MGWRLDAGREAHKHIRLASTLWRIYQYLTSGMVWRIDLTTDVENRSVVSRSSCAW